MYSEIADSRSLECWPHSVRCPPREPEAQSKGEHSNGVLTGLVLWACSTSTHQALARHLKRHGRSTGRQSGNVLATAGCVNCCWSPPELFLQLNFSFTKFLPQELCLSSLQISFRVQKPSQLISHWDRDPIICFQTEIYFHTSSSHINAGRPSCSLLVPPVFFCWYYTNKKNKQSYDKHDGIWCR